MKTKKLNFVIILGLVATIGILVAQLLWTKEAFNLEEKKFSQSTHIALLEVVKKLYEGTNSELPSDNPIKKIANDYYIVNVENDFEPQSLEVYLKQEFTKFNINTDFEFAMYNCQSDEMVYGNYVSFGNKKPQNTSVYFPKHKNLVYYFAVRFPNENTFLLSSMRFWLLLSVLLVLILLVYVYSIYTIIQQKKYSVLQRDFINNMTHEFKTPLASILLASNYLSKQDEISSDEKLKKYTQIITSQSIKLNQHIEKILDIAKTDVLKLSKTKFSVNKLISEIKENALLENQNLEISIQSNAEVFIDADEFHFTNIIYNLIDNSVKYGNQNVSILIDLKLENNTLKFTFCDNGVGVSKDKLQLIFDKFYRIETENTSQSKGFGLGLYYVKKICLEHHWKIFAENNQPNGLKISIVIPISNE